MLELVVAGEESWPAGIDWTALARRAVDAAIAESDQPTLATCPALFEISLTLEDDEAVRILNRDYRGKDKATNVLSFPLMDEIDPDCTLPHEQLLGDIVLARGVCAAEAEEKGVAMSVHASHLIVHGTLHLLGYDHIEDDEAEYMEAAEVRALARLDIANPYAAE